MTEVPTPPPSAPAGPPSPGPPAPPPPGPPAPPPPGPSALPPQRPGWTVAILIVFTLVIVGAVIFNAPVIDRLRDQVFARGLITFLISISTIGIAFLLVYQAFFSVESSDERFRRGREIFTGLMGVLGTIVGFYFGSAEKPEAKPEIAEIRVLNSQLVTHVTGGAGPYLYTLTFSEKGVEPIRNQSSEDGWIIQTIPPTVKSGTIRVDVRDSKDRNASKEYKLADQGVPQGGAAGTGPQGQTQPPKPPTQSPKPPGS